MNDHELRRHPRLRHKAKIRVIVPVVCDEFIADMRDFSQSGLFLLAQEPVGVEKDSIIEVQTTEFDDAPVQRARVVRIEEGLGFAVEFIDN